MRRPGGRRCCWRRGLLVGPAVFGLLLLGIVSGLKDASRPADGAQEGDHWTPSLVDMASSRGLANKGVLQQSQRQKKMIELAEGQGGSGGMLREGWPSSTPPTFGPKHEDDQSDSGDSASAYGPTSVSATTASSAHRRRPSPRKDEEAIHNGRKDSRPHRRRPPRRPSVREADYHYPYRPKFPAHPELLGVCRLEDFEFGTKDQLGRGGFGRVFRALHRPSGKAVALKLITAAAIEKSPWYVEDEETIQRIMDHPNIGRLLCSMRSPANDIYIALEYFAGDNLAKRIPLMYPLSRDLMVKLTAQILLALNYIHQHGIIFRDLKAENIMLDANDNVKLIDFGLSIYHMDKVTKLAGTLEYMAPEVAARESYGRASDYYSLGVLVYLLSQHRLPYRHEKGGRKQDFAAKIASGEIYIPKTGDSPVDQIISILADRDQDRRWRNVYMNFRSFQKLAFFEGFDWSYYECDGVMGG